MISHEGGTSALIGILKGGGVLIVGDHASNHVPVDIDLRIDPALLGLHIARDIGVAEVARALIAAQGADVAYLAGVSRLVIDCNRDEHAPGLVPMQSDGHAIAGNALDDDARATRIDRFYRPYHDKLAEIVAVARPAMILSLHSFTPVLETQPDTVRPWQIGILYNEDDRLARVAISALESAGVIVGDQLPYSGKDLNYTMDRHAEGNGIPYLGVEMRQDLVADAGGVARMVEWLQIALGACRNELAQIAAAAA